MKRVIAMGATFALTALLVMAVSASARPRLLGQASGPPTKVSHSASNPPISVNTSYGFTCGFYVGFVTKPGYPTNAKAVNSRDAELTLGSTVWDLLSCSGSINGGRHAVKHAGLLNIGGKCKTENGLIAQYGYTYVDRWGDFRGMCLAYQGGSLGEALTGLTSGLFGFDPSLFP